MVAIEEGTATVSGDDGEKPETSRYSVIYVKQDGHWLQARIQDLTPSELSAHDHLKDLEWMLGEWVNESDDELVSTTCSWSDNGSFLIREFDVKIEGKVALSGTQRIGWDPLRKQFRTWVFDSEGGFAEGLVSHDDDLDQWIVQSSGVRADGQPVTVTSVFTPLDPDRIAWQTVERTVGGVALPGLDQYILVRKPPSRPLDGPNVVNRTQAHPVTPSFVEDRSMFRVVGRLMLLALLIGAVTALPVFGRGGGRGGGGRGGGGGGMRRRRRRWWHARWWWWHARGAAVWAVAGASRQPVDQRTASGRWGWWCPARWRRPARRVALAAVAGPAEGLAWERGEQAVDPAWEVAGRGKVVLVLIVPAPVRGDRRWCRDRQSARHRRWPGDRRSARHRRWPGDRQSARHRRSAGDRRWPGDRQSAGH